MKYFLQTFILGLFLIGNSYAAIESAEFNDPEQAALYKKMIDELRCLVCQNQNLADSNAGLARDLRVEVRRMIQQGNNEKQIVDFMTTRYGDFVLYRPPFKSYTLILWLGPFVGLVLAIFILLGIIRKRQSVQSDEISEDERQKLNTLLDKKDSDEKKDE